jgi:tetratricopeptide (TPR) repeat protein
MMNRNETVMMVGRTFLSVSRVIYHQTKQAGMPVLLLLCLMFSQVFAQSERSHIRDGNSAYKEKKYSDAEVSYKKSLEKNKDLVEGSFNLGDALYKQDRFGEAAEQYRMSAMKAKDNETKAQALHNLGNSLMKEQKFQESLAAYKEALKTNPKDADTKYNYEYAKKMLQQQQQQQQQQRQEKKDDKKQDEKQNQDQQKQDQQKQQQQQQKQEQQKQEQAKQQQAQQKKQQISKEDAERILEALKNDEKKVQKKLQKKVPARGQVEKDW